MLVSWMTRCLFLTNCIEAELNHDNIISLFTMEETKVSKSAVFHCSNSTQFLHTKSIYMSLNVQRINLLNKLRDSMGKCVVEKWLGLFVNNPFCSSVRVSSHRAKLLKQQKASREKRSNSLLTQIHFLLH